MAETVKVSELAEALNLEIVEGTENSLEREIIKRYFPTWFGIDGLF